MPAPDPGPTYGFLAAPTYSEYRLTTVGALTGNGSQPPLAMNSQCAYGAKYTGYQIAKRNGKTPLPTTS